MSIELTNHRMNDGSRQFVALPENCSWSGLRRHLGKMAGVSLGKFLTDELTEAWIDFSYRGYSFTINNQFGEFLFFSSDPNCPDDILAKIVEHCQAECSMTRESERLAERIVATDWPFDRAPNVAAITTRQVVEDNLPILVVTHYSDDHSWAFLCGTTNRTEDGRVIRMDEALKTDPTLASIANLAPGYSATRTAVGAAWTRKQTCDEMCE